MSTDEFLKKHNIDIGKFEKTTKPKISDQVGIDLNNWLSSNNLTTSEFLANHKN